MTRIVAGTVGGRRIEVPRSGTRPTSERVREALFARLDHYGVLDGARVLDLCAGSGALGLEAASRGAGEVTLVDSSRGASQTCQRNIRSLGLSGVSAVTAKAATFLAGAAGAPADLVLIDPPYELSEEELTAILTPPGPQRGPVAGAARRRRRRALDALTGTHLAGGAGALRGQAVRRDHDLVRRAGLSRGRSSARAPVLQALSRKAWDSSSRRSTIAAARARCSLS